jgi:hypothetical protein
MQQDFFAQLRKAISHERLEAYQARSNASDALTLAAHYARNIALSESLYPSLQAIEIALRNSIHDAISAYCNSEEWYAPHCQLLLPQELLAIEKARITLGKGKKSISPGGIMAELNFGFWTSLFDLRYEQRLWPRHLKSVFPNIPRTARTRKNLSTRLNRIRRLRNRVFHHEPIWYWRDLSQQHQEVIEVIGWINPAMKSFIFGFDRFVQVENRLLDDYQERVSSIARATGERPVGIVS